MGSPKELVQGSLDRIRQDIGRNNDILLELSKKLAAMEEHLRGINGRIQAHDNQLVKFDTLVYENRISLARIFGTAAGAAIFGSIFITIVMRILHLG